MKPRSVRTHSRLLFPLLLSIVLFLVPSIVFGFFLLPCFLLSIFFGLLGGLVLEYGYKNKLSWISAAVYPALIFSSIFLGIFAEDNSWNLFLVFLTIPWIILTNLVLGYIAPNLEPSDLDLILAGFLQILTLFTIGAFIGKTFSKIKIRPIYQAAAIIIVSALLLGLLVVK